MFLIQRSLYLRLKQIRHPHGMTDLYVGSFWENSHSGDIPSQQELISPSLSESVMPL